MEPPNFFEQVYRIVRQIPEGRVTSYGAIARALGAGGSSRMVGWAMRAARTAHPPIPAHRVVNRIGVLSGKMAFGSPILMQQLLENEGVTIVDDRVVDFDRLFWEPPLDDGK
ncbi:methylated-DNA--protein-cysteine methyltransferase [Parapedobacter defluvii]|uniref:Methylated-DNA--protein-cysteine methyltransferase n=1 Tax=Parapedobacter defluvii TaxID=2045106 RepID=A0ABQ1MP39_9SPHI|nr:MGMT family protein [Parapedobacter defluvii]RQP08691.1 MAG: MGMT family protein [Parapedobacter sp.]GGC44266.1 methylated-DNA--protein-cysteine methyltransferase [Parapedobacter defluvii]